MKLEIISSPPFDNSFSEIVEINLFFFPFQSFIITCFLNPVLGFTIHAFVFNWFSFKHEYTPRGRLHPPPKLLRIPRSISIDFRIIKLSIFETIFSITLSFFLISTAKAPCPGAGIISLILN